jgi:hypothetical protein
LKESWIGEKDLPFSLGKTTTKFLQELGERLIIAKEYAEQHSDAVQYNWHSREKHFVVGEKCLVLIPHSTANKVFSHREPDEIHERESAYGYHVETEDGKRYRLRAYMFVMMTLDHWWW